MSLILDLPDIMRSDAVRAIFAALDARGGPGSVRFVGGCVRNVVMGLAPSDLDLATRLTPDETEYALAAAGLKRVPTGKAFGTITAVVDGEPFEITSLREDVETDGRRAVVSYTTDWELDAKRRDFYLNALYADGTGRVYDPTRLGIEDARQGRVRFIGEAEQRIREDYLRILRFFRFTAAYGRTIDETSLNACVALKAGIDGLSGERIWQELIKTLALADPMPAFETMQRMGLMPQVLPGWRLVAGGLPELKAMVAQTTDAERRLMALVDAGLGLAPDALDALRTRLKFSTRVYDRLVVAGLVAEYLANDEDLVFGRLIYRFGRQAVEDAISLIAAHQGRSASLVLGLLEDIVVPAFPLRGADLIARGLKPGPQVGQKLKQIETEWVNNDFSQTVIDHSLDEIGKRPKS
jgi:poly(A) polymerase